MFTEFLIPGLNPTEALAFALFAPAGAGVRTELSRHQLGQRISARE